MGHREAKDALYDGFAGVAKALANGRRAELVDVLEQGPRHVEELAGEIDQSIANTSFHLRTLAAAGLVTTERVGSRVYYRLASERVAELWGAIRDVAAAHSSRLDALARAYVGDREGIEEIGRQELVERLFRGEVLVIDVRPRAEYEAGHIEGALSIPVTELPGAIGSLPPDVGIVAYCRGPYCVFADEAVRHLTAAGRSSFRLEGGFPEWRRHGYPVAAGRARPAER
ncbi:MAG TPA: metalloregulator ArsR/SmtB family transcription factor [Acidimicrobiales bacterium]|nr:metalloregulator ArsR/SmtB family transcription factor [Acidimicrobiales bacterium]